jgi:hemolysin activation/secretion protein
VLRATDGSDRLQLATFIDVGHGWDEGETFGPSTLSAVGLGLRWHLPSNGLATVYWGIPLRHVHTTGDDWLQNHGLHLGLSFSTDR